MNLLLNKQRLISEFMELVKIDSETKHEALIAVYLKDLFTNLGLKVKEDKAAEQTGYGANNLICTLAANSPDITPILFTCHMDTVLPGKNIKPIEKEGFIISDGTTILGADDKAGIAVLIEAIRVITENKMKHGSIQFIITVGEESGLVGARVLDYSLLHAKFGFALDADGPVGNIIIQAPYQAKIFTVIRGKSAHAGINPEKGISAINVASKAIAKMKLGRIDSETTANIGSFKGGTQTNIICDYVEIEAETRSLQEDKLKNSAIHIKQTFEQVSESYGATADVKIYPLYPGFNHKPHDPLVKLAVAAAKQVNLTPKLVKTNGGSDANIFNQHIPTINLSVGYEYIHTTKERIKPESLVALTNYVLAIIEETKNMKQ